MEVTVNGTPRTLTSALTVAQLVAELTEQHRGIAVALNGAVVPRAGWDATALRDGDRLEVLTAAQGG